MRAELAGDKIFVTTVTPGLMRTGSQIHAKFKGDHAAEYRWFDLSRKIPFASISAERAARKILRACQRGKSVLVMPWSAYLIIAMNALFPNLTSRVMKAMNRAMPPAVSQSGNEARSGAEVRGKK